MTACCPKPLPPQPVVLSLNEGIDVSRGDMIVRKKNLPHVGNRMEATICWMDETASNMMTPYIMKHTTRYVKAYISKIIYKIDVNTLHREQADAFGLNEIERVEISTASPVFLIPIK